VDAARYFGVRGGRFVVGKSCDGFRFEFGIGRREVMHWTCVLDAKFSLSYG
jgi:hypothetical protein